MSATVTLRAYTGANAGTESSPLSTVALISQDAITGNPVAPGSVSYERWLRLRVDVAPVTGVANFWLQNAGDLPDGVSILFGVTDTPATPVNTPSLVATKTLTPGQKFWWDMHDYANVGDHSRYLVLQEVVANTAAPGAIPTQGLTFGFVEQ